MAKLPTPEESGKRVLGIYKGDGIRPGQLITWGSLHSRFVTAQWRAADLEAGLQWCIEQGYLEEKKPKIYFLTEAGFALL